MKDFLQEFRTVKKASGDREKPFRSYFRNGGVFVVALGRHFHHGLPPRVLDCQGSSVALFTGMGRRGRWKVMILLPSILQGSSVSYKRSG